MKVLAAQCSQEPEGGLGFRWVRPKEADYEV
jgi:hypothetical protein